ncbi:hypothetical protein [Parachlamydia acanthamoebae]|nr:hypothetical protein [Parachlamydia acanthamoebae]EFB41583.1 hypothetical protein pah_c026o001 [Parachlamydia acanthamoebae str. Hall's coccus]
MTPIIDFFREAAYSDHTYLKVDKLGELWTVQNKSERSSLRKISAYAKKILENSDIKLEDRKQLAVHFKKIVESFENKKKSTPKILFLKKWIRNLIKKYELEKSYKILRTFDPSYTRIKKKKAKEILAPYFKDNSEQAVDFLQKAPIGTYAVWQQNSKNLMLAFRIPSSKHGLVISQPVPLNANSPAEIERLTTPQNQFKILETNGIAYPTTLQMHKNLPLETGCYSIFKTKGYDVDYIMIVKTQDGFVQFNLKNSEDESLFQQIEKNLTPARLEKAEAQKANDIYVANHKNHIGYAKIKMLEDGQWEARIKMDASNDYLLVKDTEQNVTRLKTEAGFRLFLHEKGYFFDNEEDAKAYYKAKNKDLEFVLWENKDKTISMWPRLVLTNSLEHKPYIILEHEDIRTGIQRVFNEFYDT